ASDAANSPSEISARRRSTESLTTAFKCRETTTKTSPSSTALAPTRPTPKSCQAPGSYAEFISGICRIRHIRGHSGTLAQARAPWSLGGVRADGLPRYLRHISDGSSNESSKTSQFGFILDEKNDVITRFRKGASVAYLTMRVLSSAAQVLVVLDERAFP